MLHGLLLCLPKKSEDVTLDNLESGASNIFENIFILVGG